VQVLCVGDVTFAFDCIVEKKLIISRHFHATSYMYVWCARVHEQNPGNCRNKQINHKSWS